MSEYEPLNKKAFQYAFIEQEKDFESKLKPRISYGFIKEINGDIVDVQVSAKESKDTARIIKCKFLNFATENLVIDSKPYINMRVLAFTISEYHDWMFNTPESIKDMFGKPIVEVDTLLRYSDYGGVCIPLANDSESDNRIVISDTEVFANFSSFLKEEFEGKVEREYGEVVEEIFEKSVKIRYKDKIEIQYDKEVKEDYLSEHKKVFDKNIEITSYGNITLRVKKDKDTETCVINIDKEGKVSIEIMNDSKISIKNKQKSFVDLFKDLTKILKNFKTAGSPTSHLTDPTTYADLINYEQTTIDKILE